MKQLVGSPVVSGHVAASLWLVHDMAIGNVILDCA